MQDAFMVLRKMALHLNIHFLKKRVTSQIHAVGIDAYPHKSTDINQHNGKIYSGRCDVPEI